MSPLLALCTDKSWMEKKRLGDYSFVSDVISVAVLFDLPALSEPTIPHPALIHYFLTLWPCFYCDPPLERPPTPMHRLHILLVSTLSAPPLFSHSHKRHNHK